MSESNFQAEVIKYLEITLGHVATNIISASKNGVADIISCDKEGRYWALETKLDYNQLSKLQIAFGNKIIKNNGYFACIKSIRDIDILLLKNLPLKEITTKANKINL